MDSKLCTMCKETLPLTSFPEIPKGNNNYRKQRSRGHTHEDRCRPCKAQYARQWRKKNAGYRGSGKITSIPPEDRLLISAIGARLTNAFQRTKRYGGVEPNIDRDYLYRLFKDQQGKCAISGVVLKTEVGAVACLSLDKKIPELGYVKGNVQWVAWAVNRAKGDMTEDVFIDMCRQILEHQKVQRLSKSSAS